VSRDNFIGGEGVVVRFGDPNFGKRNTINSACRGDVPCRLQISCRFYLSPRKIYPLHMETSIVGTIAIKLILHFVHAAVCKVKRSTRCWLVACRMLYSYSITFIKSVDSSGLCVRSGRSTDGERFKDGCYVFGRLASCCCWLGRSQRHRLEPSNTTP
jgi:hypothetical protein